MERILLIKPHRIGDVLLTTPLIRGLREKYPRAYLAFVVDDICREAVETNPDLDEVFVVDRARFLLHHRVRTGDPFQVFNELSALVGKMQERQFNMVINLLYEPFGIALPYLLGAEDVRGPTLSEKGTLIIKDKWSRYLAALPRKRRQNKLNLVNIFLNIGDIPLREGKINLPVDGEARKFRDGFLEKWKIGPDDLVFGIQPGASMPSKCWSKERFAQVADNLMRKYGARVIIFGAREERKLVGEVAGLMKEKPVIAAGATNLARLAALLEKCRLLVSNDTATVHVAASVKTPVVGICHGAAYPVETGPYGQGHIALQANIPCVPCLKLRCCKERKCLDIITVEAVLEAVELQMRLSPAAPREREALYIKVRKILKDESFAGIQVYYSEMRKGALRFVPLPPGV